jgi:hypothetical protein
MPKKLWLFALVVVLLGLLSYSRFTRSRLRQPTSEVPPVSVNAPEPSPKPPRPQSAEPATPARSPIERPEAAPEPPPPPPEPPADINDATASQAVIPDFPWPPPTASATYLLPLRQPSTQRPSTFGNADSLISGALAATGYVERSYYAVPEGFALVTRLEQINLDGTPKDLPERWSVEAPRLTSFSLEAYMNALFLAAPGYYRVIVFIATPVRFYQVDAHVTGATAQHWLAGGLNELPKVIASLPYTDDVTCTALIYEFRREQGKPDILVPGRLDGLTHIRRSGIASALGM